MIEPPVPSGGFLFDDGGRMPQRKPDATAKAGTGGTTRAAGKLAKAPLLSGGNPQVAKGEGDAPVQAYIAAMPGWKRELGRKLDTIIVAAVPNVEKAVKWNSPFYGVDGRGWVLNFHVYARYVKVTFFQGASLKPMPPGESKHADVRYLDITEDGFDDAQFTKWVRQAAKLPGWMS